jgi:hypothetical protein
MDSCLGPKLVLKSIQTRLLKVTLLHDSYKRAIYNTRWHSGPHHHWPLATASTPHQDPILASSPQRTHNEALGGFRSRSGDDRLGRSWRIRHLPSRVCSRRRGMLRRRRRRLWRCPASSPPRHSGLQRSIWNMSGGMLGSADGSHPLSSYPAASHTLNLEFFLAFGGNTDSQRIKLITYYEEEAIELVLRAGCTGGSSQVPGRDRYGVLE